MKVMVSISGQHPRNEETVRATQDWERGRISTEELKISFMRDIQDLISLQESLDFDFISDGQMTTAWNDLFRPITTKAEGVKKGPLVRWFNTNTFYYAPVIYDELDSDGNILLGTLSKQLLNTKKAKVVVPDPLTFAECSMNLSRLAKEDVMFSYSRMINKELKTLERNGVIYVQFSSPSFSARFRERELSREEIRLLGESLRVAIKQTRLRTCFYTYFGDSSKYMNEMFDTIPTDDVGFDFTETKLDWIPESSKCLVAGVVNARSSYVEKEEEVLKLVKGVSGKFSELILCPSSDLQYIPRKYADMKLRLLSKVKSELNE